MTVEPMEQVTARIERAHAGDKEAREQLVAENMGLVYSIVKRFENRGHDREELIQIGSIGLIKAVDKFDPSFGVRFSTYAVPVISGEIRRFLRDDGLIKVSRSLKENAYHLYQASERLSHTLGREPTFAEICEESGLTAEEAVLALDAKIEVESIYKSVSQKDGSEVYLVDQVMAGGGGVGCVHGGGTSGAGSEAEDVAVNRLLVEELLSELTQQEKKLIEMRYFQEKTQSVTAKELGISQVQVSRIEKKALLRMRSSLGNGRSHRRS